MLHHTGFVMDAVKMQYVLDNEISRRQCGECLGIWFHFNHEGNNAFYRLSMLAPEDCERCNVLDQKVEAECLYSVAQWVKA